MMKNVNLTSMLVVLFLFSMATNLFSQEELKNSLVKISAKSDDGREETGAGIIVGYDKGSQTVFVVTAFHVVGDYDQLDVYFRSTWMKFQAEFFKYADDLDLAVIKIHFSQVEAMTMLPFIIKVEKAKPGSYKPLDRVLAIGHPAGSDFTANPSNGIQEAMPGRLSITKNGIMPGYSGGPVFNLNGHLLGMLTEITSVSAKTIPISKIVQRLDEWGIPSNMLIDPKLDLKWLIWSGSGAVLGGTGLFLQARSQDNHAIYAAHRSTMDPIYQEMGLDRDELYQRANSQNHAAIVSGAVGAALFTYGAVKLIQQASQKSKLKKQEGYTFQPKLDLGTLVATGGQVGQMGVVIRF